MSVWSRSPARRGEAPGGRQLGQRRRGGGGVRRPRRTDVHGLRPEAAPAAKLRQIRAYGESVLARIAQRRDEAARNAARRGRIYVAHTRTWTSCTATRRSRGSSVRHGGTGLHGGARRGRRVARRHARGRRRAAPGCVARLLSGCSGAAGTGLRHPSAWRAGGGGRAIARRVRAWDGRAAPIEPRPRVRRHPAREAGARP